MNFLLKLSGIALFIASLLLVGLKLSSCKMKPIRPEDRIHIQKMPNILLEQDSNVLSSTDIFGREITLDSASSDGPFKLRIPGDSTKLQIVIEAKLNQSVYNLTLSVDGLHYSFPLETYISNKITFSYPALDGITKVKVIGHFGNQDLSQFDPSLSQFILNKRNSLWLASMDPFVGAFRYLYQIEEKDSSYYTSDPINSSSYTDEQGKLWSVHTESEFSIPKLELMGARKGKLQISAKNCTGIYAYWEHFLLEIEQTADGYNVMIPPFAQYSDSSVIILKAYNRTFSGETMVLGLRKGKVKSENDL